MPTSPVGFEIEIVMGLQDDIVCRIPGPSFTPDRQAPSGLNYMYSVTFELYLHIQ